MKAVICTKYGPPEVLELREIKRPVPEDDEVLIKIFATTVSSGDVRIRSFDVPPLAWIPFRMMMGFTKPRKKILGFTLAGRIEAVGRDVKLFEKGDQVFGSTGFSFGAYAEYICLGEDDVLVVKSDKMTHEEAAAIPFGGTSALHFLREGKLKEGQKVLIYGASGSLGTAAVQIAKFFGAEVTGVCSGANLKLVKSLGADFVIDYTKDDFTKGIKKYDIIFDTVGKSPFSGSVRVLKKRGYYLKAVHMTLGSIIRGIWTNLTTKKKVIGGVAQEQVEDLSFLKGLVEKGFFKPVIDKSYPLSKIVEAHRYVEKGHKKGNVVITMAHK